jgi:hypothetical protein
MISTRGIVFNNNGKTTPSNTNTNNNNNNNNAAMNCNCIRDLCYSLLITSNTNNITIIIKHFLISLILFTCTLYFALHLHQSFLNLFGMNEGRILDSTLWISLFFGLVLHILYLVIFWIKSTRLRKWLLFLSLFSLLFLSYSLYGIHHGTMSWWIMDSSCFSLEDDVSYYFITIPRNIDRKCSFEARMKRAGVQNCTAIMGIDASKYDTTIDLLQDYQIEIRDEKSIPPPPPEVRSFVAVTLGVQRALETMYKDASTEWVILFEDDAVVLSHFHQYLNQALCEYEGYDMIWLDTRNAANWFFLRRLDGGSNAICYRRSSLLKIASYLDFNSEFMTSARLSNGYDTPRHQFDATGIDVSLARMCNQGYMKCASVPLVVESGAPKTTVMGKS